MTTIPETLKICNNFTHTHPFNGLFARTTRVIALTLLVGRQEGPVRTEVSEAVIDRKLRPCAATWELL